VKDTIRKTPIKQRCIKCKEYFVQAEITKKCTNCTTMKKIVEQFLTEFDSKESDNKPINKRRKYGK